MAQCHQSIPQRLHPVMRHLLIFARTVATSRKKVGFVSLFEETRASVSEALAQPGLGREEGPGNGERRHFLVIVSYVSYDGIR